MQVGVDTFFSLRLPLVPAKGRIECIFSLALRVHQRADNESAHIPHAGSTYSSAGAFTGVSTNGFWSAELASLLLSQAAFVLRWRFVIAREFLAELWFRGSVDFCSRFSKSVIQQSRAFHKEKFPKYKTILVPVQRLQSNQLSRGVLPQVAQARMK